jgi:hypothetical protein
MTCSSRAEIIYLSGISYYRHYTIGKQECNPNKKAFLKKQAENFVLAIYSFSPPTPLTFDNKRVKKGVNGND